MTCVYSREISGFFLKECVCRLTDCVVVCRARPDGGGVRPLHAHARQMCPRAGQVSFKETIQQDLRGFENGSVKDFLNSR
jgi:hypothetical protein